MHVTATPLMIELPTGEPAHIAVSITNTSALIDAYEVDVFGLDPSWVTVMPTRLSLFPSEVGIVEIIVALPSDVPAGLRTIAVHVRSENDRAEFSLAQVSLDVGVRSRTMLQVDPVMVTGGSHAVFSLIVGNQGNATVQERPRGEDPEDVVEMMFDPPSVVLPPARREVVVVDVRCRRPWFGQPKPRTLLFSLESGSPPVMATFLQKPRIGRWLLALLGLVTAATVFAVVLSTVADRLVDESSVDPRLIDSTLAQPAGGDGGMASVTPSAITGKVVVASTGQGVAGVTADLYGAGNGSVVVASAASDPSGAFAFSRLPNGRYRIKISGAGFAEQWYKESATFADATDVDVEAGEPVVLADIEILGRPGRIVGEVIAADPTGAVARLVVPGIADPSAEALVDEVTVSADGSFTFEDVPSPATYQLVVEKPGFAVETRDVALGAAQVLEGIEVVLREGDGVVAGRVDSPAGPLGGVDIIATGGEIEVSTVSLTVDDVGAFSVRTLPTPGRYTLTFSKAGFESATRTVDLTQGQQVGGLAINLAPTTGSIAGTVSLATGPIGGVTVTITGPDVDVTTTTASVGAIGTYVFEDLPTPATYTITFSKEGLLSQTRLEDLDGRAGRSSLTGIDARMVPSTAIVGGTVRSADGQPVAGASVALSDGSEIRELLSANDPPGRFSFSTVLPGAYTLTASLPGTSPTVTLVNVVAADVVDTELVLQPQASLFGVVLRLDPLTGQFVPFVGAEVRLYEPAAFPGTPQQALAVATAADDGSYQFGELDAPADFVVAVYTGPTSGEVLDSALVQTQPSAAAEVPTFRIRVVS